MQPELHIGPLTLQTFGICFGVAFLACGLVLARRLQELGKPRDWAYEIVFSALVGGIVGARLDYIVQNYSKVSNDLLGNIFSGTGLVWLGGLLGGAAGVLIWAWRRGFLGAALLDMCSSPLALGYAIGRIGCQVSGDGDYGKPSSLPWAMSYPKGTVPTHDKVHPTPVYETLAMGALALVLWNLRDRYRPGTLFALYLVLAGLERLLVEFIRRNSEAALGLTLPQLISVGMMAAGAAWLLRARRSHPAAAGS
ncbi:MAG: phosphatidylglycerol---prolipoprotein diacylglyceryl transferase [Thermoleophilaceae bacterium]|nr:phosphatidylglycerol---prolipoprotein diacylglyceryl transferase [Thermoleophilaceae bacterium]